MLHNLIDNRRNGRNKCDSFVFCRFLMIFLFEFAFNTYFSSSEPFCSCPSVRNERCSLKLKVIMINQAFFLVNKNREINKQRPDLWWKFSIGNNTLVKFSEQMWLPNCWTMSQVALIAFRLIPTPLPEYHGDQCHAMFNSSQNLVLKT